MASWNVCGKGAGRRRGIQKFLEDQGVILAALQEIGDWEPVALQGWTLVKASSGALVGLLIRSELMACRTGKFSAGSHVDVAGAAHIVILRVVRRRSVPLTMSTIRAWKVTRASCGVTSRGQSYSHGVMNDCKEISTEEQGIC